MSYQISGELSFVAVGQWCLDRQHHAIGYDGNWQNGKQAISPVQIYARFISY